MIKHLYKDVIDQKHHYRVIKDLIDIRDAMAKLDVNELELAVQTYEQITRHSVSIAVHSHTSDHLELHTYNQMIEYFKTHKQLSFDQYYPNADKWVVFRFKPHNPWTDPVVIIAIILRFIFMFMIIYLIIYSGLKLFRQSIHELGNGNSNQSYEQTVLKGKVYLGNGNSNQSFLGKTKRVLEQKVKDLIAERTMILATLFHDIKTPLGRAKVRLQTKYELDQVPSDLDEIDELIKATVSYYQESTQDTSFKINTIFAKLKQQHPDKISINTTQDYIVHGNETLLYRAFSNITNNAIKYAKHCTIDCDLEQNKLIIHFQDTGPGVSKDKIDKLFLAHHKNLHSEQNSKGHGLGLAICKKIIELHKGEISASSNEQGLCITVKLTATEENTSPL
ncbi:sensor histidine kinase [Cysteiniphilum sp. 6C5]|uniref:sensor histidine kinase n=1 Tax=unclassified Cysteiniphilum TaxID=2610889 RepID=UPI003F854355